MDILLLEEASCSYDLQPFTLTRSILDIRMGILTLREKWAHYLGQDAFRLSTGEHRGPALPANLLPNAELASLVRRELEYGPLTSAGVERLLVHGRLIRYPWDIFHYNNEALREDFTLLTSGRQSQPIPAGVQAIAPEQIFIEAGAKVSFSILNASTGPIYIARDAEIMEGSLIRGPFAAGTGASVKMGTKIYGATTLGPYTTAGGEIKNVVFFGYSNKGHDGYLGDAVIGEWCNLGAGVSASNLKNNASDVRVYHPATGTWRLAGMKCGLLMGDYSRAAINTSFNTGTVVGVACNVFGDRMPPKYLPDFSWGGEGNVRYEWDKALRDIANWKKLKNQLLSETEIMRLKHIFGQLNN